MGWIAGLKTGFPLVKIGNIFIVTIQIFVEDVKYRPGKKNK